MLIKIHLFCQDLNGYHFQFLEVISLYYGEAGIWIVRCREDCYDLSNHGIVSFIYCTALSTTYSKNFDDHYFYTLPDFCFKNCVLFTMRTF